MNWFESHPYLVSYAAGNLLSFILFCLYLEMNPKMTSILFRPDQKGKWTFSLCNITGYLTAPFNNSLVWKPSFWDLNFIVFTQVGAVAFTVLCNLNRIRQTIGLD